MKDLRRDTRLIMAQGDPLALPWILSSALCFVIEKKKQ
jgi:hypothetical protein